MGVRGREIYVRVETSFAAVRSVVICGIISIRIRKDIAERSSAIVDEDHGSDACVMLNGLEK